MPISQPINWLADNNIFWETFTNPLRLIEDVKEYIEDCVPRFDRETPQNDQEGDLLILISLAKQIGTLQPATDAQSQIVQQTINDLSHFWDNHRPQKPPFAINDIQYETGIAKEVVFGVYKIIPFIRFFYQPAPRLKASYKLYYNEAPTGICHNDQLAFFSILTARPRIAHDLTMRCLILLSLYNEPTSLRLLYHGSNSEHPKSPMVELYELLRALGAGLSRTSSTYLSPSGSNSLFKQNNETSLFRKSLNLQLTSIQKNLPKTLTSETHLNVYTVKPDRKTKPPATAKELSGCLLAGFGLSLIVSQQQTDVPIFTSWPDSDRDITTSLMNLAQQPGWLVNPHAEPSFLHLVNQHWFNRLKTASNRKSFSVLFGQFQHSLAQWQTHLDSTRYATALTELRTNLDNMRVALKIFDPKSNKPTDTDAESITPMRKLEVKLIYPLTIKHWQIIADKFSDRRANKTLWQERVMERVNQIKLTSVETALVNYAGSGAPMLFPGNNSTSLENVLKIIFPALCEKSLETAHKILVQVSNQPRPHNKYDDWPWPFCVVSKSAMTAFQVDYNTAIHQQLKKEKSVFPANKTGEQESLPKQVALKPGLRL